MADSKPLRAPPFRAEHMGSLRRPQTLLDVRQTIRDKNISPEEAGLPPVEKEAVGNIVKLQRDCGFRCVTDGEYCRQRFWGYLWDQFIGTTRLENADAKLFRPYHPDVASFVDMETRVMPGDSVITTEPLRHSGKSSHMHELKLVQSFVPKEEWNGIKVTMITPAWFHMRYKQNAAFNTDVYKTDAEYFKDVAKAYQTELQLLYDAGLRNVQFDDPGLAYFCSEKFRNGFAQDSSNIGTVEDLLDAYIGLYNDCISKCPPDMHTGVHLCRGNFIGGVFFAEGAYDVIAKKLFQNLDVNTFYLEYDTERAGGFEPLRFLPKNKNVIVGAISTKLKQLEDKEEVKERIYKAADFVAEGSGQTREEALKRIGLSPQCGFSTHETGFPLNDAEMEAKLRLVRTIADEIWGGEP